MVAGNGSAMVYARPGEPRAERWPIERLRQPEAFGVGRDLVAALLREPAVAWWRRNRGRRRVGERREGAALRLRRRRDGISRYGRWTGDPLAVGGARAGSTRDWLEATWDAEYPDAAYHLLDQFRAQRTGDLLVVAREGYDFRRRFEVPEHRSGHGSLMRAHMQTPVWSSEPLPAEPIRTVDLFPAMLDWLGVPVPEGIDGEAIWPAAAAGAVGWRKALANEAQGAQ